MQKLIHANIVSFNDDPKVKGSDAVDHYEQGALVIGDDGKILWVGDQSKLPAEFKNLEAEDHSDHYLMAGFIDTHVHYPQYRMLGAPGKNLMDWLTRFTFKEEAKYHDDHHAKDAASHFLNFLFENGTTTCMAFSSVHKSATDQLFQAASKHNMSIITGKTMMNRNAPDAVLDTAEQSGIDTQALIEKWHNNGRNLYAVTPRFAITSDSEQLGIAGEIYKSDPSLFMQTHLSESHEEIQIVKELYPNNTNYTDVYREFNLLGEKSFFGHGIHLSNDECEMLSKSGSVVVHCPTSNTFLGSGFLNLDYLEQHQYPVKVSLASDIGGGTSYSMHHTIGEAFKIASYHNIALSALEGLYRATLGNAKTLGLENEIGSIKAGNYADFILIDPKATNLLKARQELSETLEDSLFALNILGDDRIIKATYVAGNPVYKA